MLDKSKSPEIPDLHDTASVIQKDGGAPSSDKANRSGARKPDSHLTGDEALPDVVIHGVL